MHLILTLLLCTQHALMLCVYEEVLIKAYNWKDGDPSPPAWHIVKGTFIGSDCRAEDMPCMLKPVVYKCVES